MPDKEFAYLTAEDTYYFLSQRYDRYGKLTKEIHGAKAMVIFVKGKDGQVTTTKMVKNLSKKYIIGKISVNQVDRLLNMPNIETGDFGYNCEIVGVRYSYIKLPDSVIYGVT